MRREDQGSGNSQVPGTHRKVVPIAMASGPEEYIPGQQEIPVRLTSLADMVQWA
jgi:NADH-quinone oxidoreductase subunit B